MSEKPSKPYGCADYRMEMMLVGMIKRLNAPDLPESERKELESEIRRIKVEIGLD